MFCIMCETCTYEKDCWILLKIYRYFKGNRCPQSRRKIEKGRIPAKVKIG